jgi:6-phosphofructokinase 1
MKAKSLPAWLSPAEAERYRIDEDRFDLTPVVLEHLDTLGIEALVPHRRRRHPLVRAGARGQQGAARRDPKTMDNDVPGTEYCIGFSSAITRAKELIDRQRTTLGSHERIGVFRIFGRDAGFSALFAAYVTRHGASFPRRPTSSTRSRASLPTTTASAPSHYAIVVAAEGAIWQGGSLEELGEAGRLRPSPEGRTSASRSRSS